jgi:hypothetical protein
MPCSAFSIVVPASPRVASGGACALRRRLRGFTLVESALVLVVVALMLVGMLAADALRVQTAIRDVAREAKALSASIDLYRARYGALRGDDPGAAARWPGVPSGNGDGALGGGFDQAVPTDPAALAAGSGSQESLLAWWHLRRAGFIVGPGEGIAAATPPIGATHAAMGLQSGAFGMPGVVKCLAGVSGAMAEGLDRSTDDGDPRAGQVRAGTSLDAVSGAYAHDARHVVCMSLDGRSGPAMQVAAISTAAAASAAGTSPTAAGTSSPESGAASGAGEEPTSDDDGTDSRGTGWDRWRDWFRGVWRRD